MKIAGETANALIIEDSGYIVRVPKDPKAIPEKSIIIGTADKTKDAVKLVEKWVKEREQKEE